MDQTLHLLLVNTVELSCFHLQNCLSQLFVLSFKLSDSVFKAFDVSWFGLVGALGLVGLGIGQEGLLGPQCQHLGPTFSIFFASEQSGG